MRMLLRRRLWRRGRKTLICLYARIENRLPVVDADKGEEGYAVGGKLSVVDFNLYLFYVWGMKMGIKILLSKCQAKTRERLREG